MNISEELNQIKYLLEYKIGRVISEIEFSNLPGVQPDKIDYRKPIPNPNILPDCFSELLKSDLNMVSFDTHSLDNESKKRVDGVDIIFYKRRIVIPAAATLHCFLFRGWTPTS